MTYDIRVVPRAIERTLCNSLVGWNYYMIHMMRKRLRWSWNGVTGFRSNAAVVFEVRLQRALLD